MGTGASLLQQQEEIETVPNSAFVVGPILFDSFSGSIHIKKGILLFETSGGRVFANKAPPETKTKRETLFSLFVLDLDLDPPCKNNKSGQRFLQPHVDRLTP